MEMGIGIGKSSMVEKGSGLTPEELTFLVEETRMREKLADESIEILSRKSYFAYTLATTMLAFYLASVEAPSVPVSWNIVSFVAGLVGIALYFFHAITFLNVHKPRDYTRIPAPKDLELELIEPSEDLVAEITFQRAGALASMVDQANSLGKKVHLQHDFLLYQTVAFVIGWLIALFGGGAVE